MTCTQHILQETGVLCLEEPVSLMPFYAPLRHLLNAIQRERISLFFAEPAGSTGC
jgi:hypothetical protein